MSSLSMTDRGVAILTRTITPDEGNFPIEAARSILSFRLSRVDQDRVNELAGKARAGTLTSEERVELDEYERIACLLELMQSKARLSLKKAGLSP